MPQVVKQQFVSRNGEWVEVPVGGGGGSTVSEVEIDNTGVAPVDPGVELWVDEADPGTARVIQAQLEVLVADVAAIKAQLGMA